MAGPPIAGWLTVEVGAASVSDGGGAVAVTGALAFLAVLAAGAVARRGRSV